MISFIAALLLSTAPAKPIERCPQWEPLIRKAGLPVKMFSYIAYRESRCLPKVIGKNAPGVPSDYGLFQINGSWKTVTSQVCKTKYGDMKVLLSPTCNVRVARYLYDHGGTGHWKGSSGAYNRKAKNEGTQNP